jgi:branched-subunit amino acid aminotransferase/4-amino-4-deoxychorismate lyase
MFWQLARVGAPPDCGEVLVTADDGRVLETETGNLFAELDGRWVTPRADGGLLPGVARGLLLERLAAAGRPAAERRLELGELGRATRLVVTNAVHGPRPARLGAAGAAGDAGDLAGFWVAGLGRA